MENNLWAHVIQKDDSNYAVELRVQSLHGYRWQRQRILPVDAQVTKFWDNEMPLPDSLSLLWIWKYSAYNKSRSRWKTEQMYKDFGPHFWGGTTQTFYGELLARLTFDRLAKFGWVPFADLRLQSLAI